MIQTRPNESRSDGAAGMPGNEPADRLRQHTEDLKRQACEIRQTASETVSQAGDKLLDAGRQTKDQVVETVRQTGSQVRERASTVLANQKDRLADEVSVFGQALHQAADTLDQHQDQAVSRYVHQAADCVDSCAEYLRDTRGTDLVRAAGTFTRRHPEVVLGGLFLAGLSLARFLKASSPRQDGDFGMRTGMTADRDYGYAATDRGYGDIGMYAGDDVTSGSQGRGMNESFGSTGGASAQLDDIARRDDLSRMDEITGLAPRSREHRGQLGDADIVPDLPREEASLTRNEDIPDVTSPQPGSYPPVTAGGTFFEGTGGQADKTGSHKTGRSVAGDDLGTIGRNDPTANSITPR
jgi:hypothetical protein